MPAKRMETIHHASGIYAFFNVKNGKCYVGSAVNLYHRLRRHTFRLHRGDHENKYLQAAWNKYGESSFVWAVLEYVHDKTKLVEREVLWIEQLNSPYNVFMHSKNWLGVRASAEKRAKISKAMKARWADDEFREKMSKAIKAVVNDPAVKERRVKSFKLKMQDPEYAERHQAIVAARKGIKRSDQARANMAEAQRKRYEDPEQRKKLREYGDRGRKSRRTAGIR